MIDAPSGGSTAQDRVREREQAGRLLWWWRMPFLAILGAAIALSLRVLGAIPGIMLTVGMLVLGIWVAQVNPWRERW